MSEYKRIETSLIKLLAERSQAASICPSEVARQVFDKDEWRAKMPLVREVVQNMENKGSIEVCQRGVPVKLSSTKGPIRLRLKGLRNELSR